MNARKIEILKVLKEKSISVLVNLADVIILQTIWKQARSAQVVCERNAFSLVLNNLLFDVFKYFESPLDVFEKKIFIENAYETSFQIVFMTFNISSIQAFKNNNGFLQFIQGSAKVLCTIKYILTHEIFPPKHVTKNKHLLKISTVRLCNRTAK